MTKKNKSTNGVQDFFIYYSGIGKSFNGDWIGFDIENDTIHVITLKSIIKIWNKRLNKTKDQYLLIIADTNYSGIWVSKALDRKYLSKYNVLVQSSVGREETAPEITIGEVKSPCWISQITCGKFSHSWLQICNEFVRNSIFSTSPIISMKGSFVILNKSKVWDNNEQHYSQSICPINNFQSIANAEQSLICIPCYGFYDESEDKNQHHRVHVQTESDDDIHTILQELNVDQLLDEINNDGMDEEKNEKRLNLKTKMENNNVVQWKSRCLLPQPSVRRLNILQGVKLGVELKHAKKVSRHISTYSRGFVFSAVLADIRQLIMGSDSDGDDNEDNEFDWND